MRIWNGTVVDEEFEPEDAVPNDDDILGWKFYISLAGTDNENYSTMTEWKKLPKDTRDYWNAQAKAHGSELP